MSNFSCFSACHYSAEIVLNLCVSWEHALLINSCSNETVLVETIFVTTCTSLVYLVKFKLHVDVLGMANHLFPLAALLMMFGG